MSECAVIVVGGGPTGLLLAGDLAGAGIHVRVLEKRSLESNLTRAFALHARSLEYLDARGVADRLVAEGFPVPEVHADFGGGRVGRVDLRHPESRFPFVLMIQQAGTERLLLERAERLGAEIVRGSEVVDLQQDEAGVTLKVRDRGGGEGERLERALYVVGADGAHSVVRDRLGVAFRGSSYRTHLLLADVRLREPLPRAINPFIGDDGVALLPPYGDGWFRATIWDRASRDIPLEAPLAYDEVADALSRISGGALTLEELRWSTRFLSERRQARHYRMGRVFLAGDAAHIHSPMGAMGMSVGLQDAGNLSWKLAAAVRGGESEWLLESYESERQPVARGTLMLSDLILRAATAPAFMRGLRAALVPALLRLPGVQDRARLLVSGLGYRYARPRQVPSASRIGERARDLSLTIAGSRERLYAMMDGIRFLLIDGSADGRFAREAAPWSDRLIILQNQGPLDDGVLALLIRPDAHLAWTSDTRGEGSAGALRGALEAWLGSARA